MGVGSLFIGYSRVDLDLCRGLVKHLRPLEWGQWIRIWYDQDLIPGRVWDQEIERRLRASRIVLLLVSADFFDSIYCKQETRVALELHDADEGVVIPVIARECGWEHTRLGTLQALPSMGKPASKWQEIDEAFTDVARGVRKVAETLATAETRYDEPFLETCRLLALVLLQGDRHSELTDFLGYEPQGIADEAPAVAEVQRLLALRARVLGPRLLDKLTEAVERADDDPLTRSIQKLRDAAAARPRRSLFGDLSLAVSRKRGRWHVRFELGESHGEGEVWCDDNAAARLSSDVDLELESSERGVLIRLLGKKKTSLLGQRAVLWSGLKAAVKLVTPWSTDTLGEDDIVLLEAEL